MHLLELVRINVPKSWGKGMLNKEACYYQSQSGMVDSPHAASAALPSQLVQAPQSACQAAGPQIGQQETSLLSGALVAPAPQTGTLPNWHHDTACLAAKVPAAVV